MIFFIYANTRIMIYKGMVYKGKYWIFEKNKGIPVSNCQHLQGYFLESVLTFLNL